ncbi:hypothetical protein BASA81_000096 [Batrachochytrium salamandrivorans]|nr:hypothetical protein BASA81_000096 [Batrachochytrium salamandrivorans]
MQVPTLEELDFALVLFLSQNEPQLYPEEEPRPRRACRVLAALLAWQKKTSALCPGPKCDPMLGNLGEMIAAGGFSQELFAELHAKHGDVVRFYIGPTNLNISVNDPELVHEVYRKCRERPHETYLFLWYLGKENLLFQRGPIVKEMRLRYGQMVAQRTQLDKLNEVCYLHFNSCLMSWTSQSGAKAVDVYAVLGPIVYDLMGTVLFDAPWLATEEGREIYRLHKKLIMEANRWVLWPVGPVFHPGFVDYVLAIRKWRNTVGALLERKAGEMRDFPERFADPNNRSAVQMILTSTNVDGTPFFSRDLAISTVCGFLNGAYDTMQATIYWVIWHLAKNPRVQQKLWDEFQSLPDKPSVDDLRQCEYLHAFIMESMRNRPTAPVNQRVNSTEDVTIGDLVVPAGTNINIPNAVTFQDERFFGAKTNEFLPERFLGNSPEAMLARKSWTAFGEFTRMCVGQMFALVEVKAMVHALVTKSIIELEHPNDMGESMIEAGASQPKVHNKFHFRPRTMVATKYKAEQDNLKWW